MKVKITPSKSKLCGTISAPSSKSFSHRMIIAAALSDGVSVITNISNSEDIEATCEAMSALGANIEKDGSTYKIKGIMNNAERAESATINCRESGSTLRFLIPIAAALGCETEFNGSGKLPVRPITPYKREMSKYGVEFFHEDGVMPFSIKGRLDGGFYELEGDVSSQFVTGLLYALPLCEKDSVVQMTSVLESKPYVDMTVASLKAFGVDIREVLTENGLLKYEIKGNQKYSPCNCAVEGDFSQAAFFFTANAIGANIKLENLLENSVQGDKKILEILSEIGYNDNTIDFLRPFSVDVADIPDLVPILTVLGCFTSGISYIKNAKRLKIKESDRLAAISNAINNIGGNVIVVDDSLEIHPVKEFTGGCIDGCNDHRIVMASAIASTKACDNIVISYAEAVAKSYPNFWQEFEMLGGKIEFIDD